MRAKKAEPILERPAAQEQGHVLLFSVYALIASLYRRTTSRPSDQTDTMLCRWVM